MQNPISSLKEYEANVGFSDDCIAARIILLLVDRIKVVGYNKIRVSPDVAGRRVAVIFSSNDVDKPSIASLIDVERRGLDRVGAFVKVYERTDGDSHLSPSKLQAVLHRSPLFLGINRVENRRHGDGNGSQSSPSSRAEQHPDAGWFRIVYASLPMCGGLSSAVVGLGIGGQGRIRMALSALLVMFAAFLLHKAVALLESS